MRYDISVITPTCDRPEGIGLAERWFARQDFAGTVQWIVADDGKEPAPCTAGQLHVRRERGRDETGALSLCNNLLAALPHVESDKIAIWEDDDLYFSNHLSDLYARLDAGAMLAGDGLQKYYNVKHRVWRDFVNVGASLCQTGMQSRMIDAFRMTIRECMAIKSYGIDTYFWRKVMSSKLPIDIFKDHYTMVGIKGLPGLAGNGVGHRPDERWNQDPDCVKMREWCGTDADHFMVYHVANEVAI